MFGGNTIFQNTRHIIKVPGVDGGLQLAKGQMFSPGQILEGSALRSIDVVENTVGSAGFWRLMINFWCRVAAHQPREASGRTWSGLVTLRAAARAFQSEHVTWGKAARVFLTENGFFWSQSFTPSYTNVKCTHVLSNFKPTVYQSMPELSHTVQVFKGNNFSSSYRQARITPSACIGPLTHVSVWNPFSFSKAKLWLRIFMVWNFGIFSMWRLTGVFIEKNLSKNKFKAWLGDSLELDWMKGPSLSGPSLPSAW